MANQDQFDDFEVSERQTETCTVCEAMLPEAVDGTLSEAEQSAFDRHVAGCVLCARELAEARRGAAWLAMLKTEAPEPPAGMLERILAGTTDRPTAAAPVQAPGSWQPAEPAWQPVWESNAAVAGLATPVAVTTPVAAMPVDLPVVPAHLAAGPQGPAPAWALSSVLRRAAGLFRIENARATFQPRLAMTSAMAFLSIALTLNLTGVRLRDLRAENFTASGLRRSMADASASATRSFQNMRVVYQVESRVSELRSDEEPGGAQDATPAAGSPAAGTPAVGTPATSEPSR